VGLADLYEHGTIATQAKFLDQLTIEDKKRQPMVKDSNVLLN
jgi:hypothetical protein